MVKVNRPAFTAPLLLLVMALVNAPASAQNATFQGENPNLQGVDLSGMWQPIRHEDVEVERAGGPPPGITQGFPSMMRIA